MSVFDDYVKIAVEKGWVVDENAYPSVVKEVHKETQEFAKNLSETETGPAQEVGKEISKMVEEKSVTKLPERQVKVKVPLSGAWVIGVQNVLARKTPFAALKVDGYWGPQTATAWNILAKSHGGLLQPVDPYGKIAPQGSDIKWVKDAYPKLFTLWLPTGEHKRSIQDKTTGDRYKEVVPTYQDRADRGLRADDVDYIEKDDGDIKSMEPKGLIDIIVDFEGEKIKEIKPHNDVEVITKFEDKKMTLQRNAKIIKELVSLANDLEELGATKVAQVVDKETRIFKKATNSLYNNVTNETAEQLIEQAHPGGGPTIAPSADEGGKVETIVEEQQKNIKKVLKNPTGKYAKYIGELIVLANKLDKDGRTVEAKMVDKTIKELHEASNRPFLNKDLVSRATKSNDFAVPMYKMANEDEFKNKFSVELSNLINFLKNTQGNMEFIDTFYREPIDRLTSLLNQFENLKIKDIYQQMKGQLKVLNVNLGKLISEKGSITDKALHRNVLKAAVKLTNGMLTFVNKIIPEKKEENQKAVEKKIEEKGVLGRAKADYIKQLAELEKLIQKFPYQLSKVLGGDDQVLGMEKWIRNQNYNTLEAPEDYEYKFAPELADAAKLKTYTLDLFKAIKQLNKGAEVTFVLQKDAGALPPFQPVVTVAPSSSKVKPKARGNKTSFDPAVQKLQQAMVSVDGLPTLKPGRGGKPDDGVWGPSTAQVYNALMGKLKVINPRAKTYSVTQNKPDQDVIGWGMKISQYLKEKQSTTELDNVSLPVYSTLTVPASMLKSADTFVNFVSQNTKSLPPNVISKVPSIPLNTDQVVDPWVKGKQLAGIVLKDITKLLFDLSFTQDLILSTGDENVIKKLKVLVNDLWSELSPHLQTPGTPGKPKAEESSSSTEKAKIKLEELLKGTGGFLKFDNISIDSSEKFNYAWMSLPKPYPYVALIRGIAEQSGKSAEDVIYQLGKLVRSMMSWITSNRKEYTSRFETDADTALRRLNNYHIKVENTARKLNYYDISKPPQKETYKKVW